jgi:hypothetical protein
MGTLGKLEILRHIGEGRLILDPLLDAEGDPQVEAASYDLRAGVVVWKDKDSKDDLKIATFTADGEQPTRP